MRMYTVKLIELIERSKEEIARQWCDDVTKNPRTKSFLGYSDNELIAIATGIYGSFRELFFSDNLKETAKKIFGRYAEERYRKGIPPHEAIYGLMLMRRRIWFYAEFRAVFISVLEQYQKEESLNRTILIFDYAVFAIVEKYESLRRSGK